MISTSNDVVLRKYLPFVVPEFYISTPYSPKRKFLAKFRGDWKFCVKKALTTAMLSCKLRLIVDRSHMKAVTLTFDVLISKCNSSWSPTAPKLYISWNSRECFIRYPYVANVWLRTHSISRTAGKQCLRPLTASGGDGCNDPVISLSCIMV